MTLPVTTTTQAARSAHSYAVLPIGSFEQHGPCLPLTTDTLIACAITRTIASSYSAVNELPPITIACSHEHAGWAGTVSISHTTLSAVVRDIAASLHASGIGKLILVNAHGGNYVLSNIVQEANAARPASMALFPRSRDWKAARQAAGLQSAYEDDMHAGEIETSILLHTHADVVLEGWKKLDHTSNRENLLIHGMSRYTKTGVIGQPSFASAEKGRLVLGSLRESFKGLLDALSN